MVTYGFFEVRDVDEHNGKEELSSVSLAVPDMSLSVKDIITRCRRGTIDLDSLIRRGGDNDLDLDDDSMDGIEDLVDIHNLKSSTDGKIREILNDSARTSGNVSGNEQESESEEVEK